MQNALSAIPFEIEGASFQPLYSSPEREKNPFEGLIKIDSIPFESDWDDLKLQSLTPLLQGPNELVTSTFGEWWTSAQGDFATLIKKRRCDPYRLVKPRGRAEKSGEEAINVVSSALHCCLLTLKRKTNRPEYWAKYLPIEDQKFVKSVEACMLSRGSRPDIAAAAMRFIHAIEFGSLGFLANQLVSSVNGQPVRSLQFKRSVTNRLKTIHSIFAGSTMRSKEFAALLQDAKRSHGLRSKCICGCGEEPKGEGLFTQGCDAKYFSRLKKAMNRSNSRRASEEQTPPTSI